MFAIGASRFLPTTDPDFLVEFETGDPSPGDQDLLVEVEAVSVNPVDTKIRATLGSQPIDPPRILGWDAAGTVVGMGKEVTGFSPGDRVFYAGDLTRPGCNSQLQSVDFRLAARMPTNLDFADSASIPLVGLTAWELLFERMGISSDGSHHGQSILVINGSGGVGSLLIPLARQAGLDVIATASRPETIAWCHERGAHHVLNHHQPLRPQLEALGLQELPWIANLHQPDPYWETVADLLAPMGTLGLIVEPAGPLRVGDPFKAKCAKIVWEFMAARAKFRLPDLARQGEILSELAARCEDGSLTPPTTRNLGPLSVETLREAHAALEGGTAHGKWVLEKIS